MPQSHALQPLSMCRQNFVRGRPENSLHQERTHAEWFSQSKCLELLPHVGISKFSLFQHEARVLSIIFCGVQNVSKNKKEKSIVNDPGVKIFTIHFSFL